MIKPRWFILIPVGVVIAYYKVGILRIESIQKSLSVNVWDVLYHTFNDPLVVFSALTTLYLFLIGDYLSDTELTNASVLRLGSRKWWWLGKVITLELATLSYIVILTGIIAGIGSFVFPFKWTWSKFELQQPSVYVHSALLTLPPGVVLLRQLMLLGLGWFSLGLMVGVITIISKRPIVGIAGGLAINFANLLAFKDAPFPPISHYFLYEHFLQNYHSFGGMNPELLPLSASVAVWLMLIAVVGAIGYWCAVRKDFIAVIDH